MVERLAQRIEAFLRYRGQAVRDLPGDQCGRSESIDPDNVGDIADEGAGHRG
jgi:hypothetical protein